MAWLESGVHIKAVADLLGHSSIAITGDIYGHTSDDTARAAVDGLADIGLRDEPPLLSALLSIPHTQYEAVSDPPKPPLTCCFSGRADRI